MVGGVQDGRAQLTPIGVSIPGTIAQTDRQGQYRLANIPPGRYYILAQAPAVANSSEPTSTGDVINLPTLYPGVSTLDDAKRIDVMRGSEVHRIDFSIIRGRGMRVRGQVFDPITGSPSRMASVNLTGGGVFASFRTVADENGAYEFTGVPAGEYVLWARGSTGSQPGSFTTRRIVIDSDTDGADLTFRPGVHVAGRLILEDGRVFTNPRGLPGITANIVEGPFGTGTNVLMDGTFRLGGPTGLIDGDYRITVDQIPEDYYVKSIVFGPTDLLKDTLKINGPPSDEIAITLGVGTSIRGKVLNENREPGFRVRVYLLPQNSGAEHLVKVVQTDQNGDFVIRGVGPGTYSSFAVNQPLAGAERDPEFIRQYESRGRIITVSQDHPITALTLTLLR